MLETPSHEDKPAQRVKVSDQISITFDRVQTLDRLTRYVSTTQPLTRHNKNVNLTSQIWELYSSQVNSKGYEMLRRRR